MNVDPNLEALLVELARQQIGLTLDAGALRLHHDHELPDEPLERVRQHRQALVDFVSLSMADEPEVPSVAELWETALVPEPVPAPKRVGIPTVARRATASQTLFNPGVELP